MPDTGTQPAWWGRFVMTPHREPEPPAQCSGCAGGGDINDVPCRYCDGTGWHEATRQSP